MTLTEIADALDVLAVELSNRLMPTADDPDRARKAYVLGLAAAAVTAPAPERVIAPARASWTGRVSRAATGRSGSASTASTASSVCQA